MRNPFEGGGTNENENKRPGMTEVRYKGSAGVKDGDYVVIMILEAY